MSAHAWVSIFAAAGQLLLAVLAIWRADRSPLRVPLALLCVDVAGWTAASLAESASPELWTTALASGVDHVLSPLTAPLALDFVLVFVGVRRSSHLTRLAAFTLCGSLSLFSLVGSTTVWLPGFVGSRAWGTWLLAAALPTMAVATATLVRHLRSTVDTDERARTWLLLLVFAVGTLFGLSEEIGHFATFTGLADVGMLICAAGMAIVALRFDLFGARFSPRSVLVFGGSAVLAFYLCVVALHWAGSRALLLVLIAIAAALAAFAGARDRLVEKAIRAERHAQLVTLGRFSAQMDHDVRNPLAALKGAAQLLARDLKRESPGIDRQQFADLVLAQADRITAIFDRFRRLSRLELVCAQTDVNTLVRAVIARQASAVPPRVTVEEHLESALPSCRLDADLVASVLENLAKNAIEAMPGGGALTITTRAIVTGPAAIELAVRDTGAGMDARTAERATDDFFTTKATGSGFGLSFARRVIEAHGGSLAIRTQLGRGTEIRLHIPTNAGET